MVRAIDSKPPINRVNSKGLEPVSSERSRGRPEVAFENSVPGAPKLNLPGNSLFAARCNMYRNMSPSQRASFMSALEGCRPEISSVYGKQAYEEVARLLSEVMEFTGKAPV